MNLHEIADAVKKANAAIKANEKIPVPILAAKAKRAAEQCPEDASLITAYQVFTKMASNKTFITRSELNNIYESLYVPNTKLAKVFEEELGRIPLQGPIVANRSSFENQEQLDFDRLTNPLLRNALEAALDGSGQDKVYDPNEAKLAKKACLAELVRIGAEPKKIEIFAGRKDIIVCNAVYETPMGYSHTLIPVEVKQGKALFPTMFLSTHGFVDLDRDMLREHIKEAGGNSYKVDGEKLLQVLSAAKNGVKKIASDVEMAVMRMRSESGTNYDPNGIVSLSVDNEASEDPIEVYQDPEHLSFAERLNNPGGVAKFVHGDALVERGRNLLDRTMRQMGYSSQIRVTDVEKDAVVYAVSVNGQSGFKVPVKIKGGMVVPPVMFIADGQLNSLSKENIDNLVKSGIGDRRMLAQASPMYELKPSELVDIVRKAAVSGEFAKAEDAINVLGETDKQSQKVAIAILMESLTPEPSEHTAKTAAQKVEDIPQMMTYKVFFPEGA